MEGKRFDPAKLHKLNNPERLKELPVARILELAKVERPEVIIDLGAGTGLFSIELAKIYPGSKIYACDISNIMINWMNEHIMMKYENIIPLRMEEYQVPLKDGIADFLLMINLHHELDEPVKTLTECHRILKPNGRLAISDWKKDRTEHGPPAEIRCDPGEIKEQLLNAGFNQINIHMEFVNNFLIAAEKVA
ncbi:MAG TPA: methyltransferase domain-containing protein [Cyclobacteriaceae bacterium]|nr:methyltransferase domain-containing protein [Cyclobacteriaceae bacterium]